MDDGRFYSISRKWEDMGNEEGGFMMLSYKGRARKPREEKPVYPREAYMKAYPFLNELRQHRQILPHQALATLRGQALSGDLDGAMKGLGRLLGRAYER